MRTRTGRGLGQGDLAPTPMASSPSPSQSRPILELLLTIQRRRWQAGQGSSFPRKSSGHISRTKVSTWSGERKLWQMESTRKGLRERIPWRSFQVPGGMDRNCNSNSLPPSPPSWICLAGCGRSLNRSNSDSPLHLPCIQGGGGQGAMAMVLACRSHPPCPPPADLV